METLRLLSKPITIEILAILSSGPQYPRIIASKLGKSEALIVRCLKELEKRGIVEGSWTRIKGRNVKMYRLKAASITIEFSAGKVSLKLKGSEEQVLSAPTPLDPPPPPENFVDREEELEALDAAAGVSIVWGPPGVGKSALAAKLAESYAGRAAWLKCDRFTDIAAVYRGIARAAGVGDGEQPAEMLARMNDVGGLLVLDDFHKAGEEVMELLYDLDQRLDRGKVLVLSRVPIPVVPTRGIIIPLNPLPKKASLELLRKMGVELEASEMEWIYDATGGNPRFLVAAANVVKSSGFDAEKIIEALEPLTASLVAELGEKEYEVLKAASVFREPVPIARVSRVASVRNARLYLAFLERRGLVRVSDGLVSVHAAVKTLLERDGELKNYHVAAANQYLLEGKPKRALYHLAKGGKYSEAVELLEELYETSRIETGDVLIKEAIEEMENIALNPIERAKLAYFTALFAAPSVAAEALETAIAEAKKAGNPILIARVFQLLGEKYARAGKRATALSYAVPAAEILKRERFPTVKLTDDVMELLLKLGKLEDAGELAESYFSSTEPGFSRVNAMYWLGVVSALSGDLERAESFLEKSLEGLSEHPLKASRARKLLSHG